MVESKPSEKEQESAKSDANRVSKDIVGQVGKAEFVSQIPRSTALPKGPLEVAGENPPKKPVSKLESKEAR